MKRPNRTAFFLLVAALLGAGAFLTWYRHVTFEVPFLPGERRQVWSVEAQIDFIAMGEAVTASLAVPGSQPGFELIGEHTASPDRKSTRLNSSHVKISYAVFCLKKK